MTTAIVSACREALSWSMLRCMCARRSPVKFLRSNCALVFGQDARCRSPNPQNERCDLMTCRRLLPLPMCFARETELVFRGRQRRVYTNLRVDVDHGWKKERQGLPGGDTWEEDKVVITPQEDNS